MQIQAYLVYSDRFSKQFDLIHDLASILGVFFRQELTKPKALM